MLAGTVLAAVVLAAVVPAMVRAARRLCAAWRDVTKELP